MIADDIALGVNETLGGIITTVIVGTFGAIRWWAKRQPEPYDPRQEIATLKTDLTAAKADAQTNLGLVEARHDKEIGALKDEVGEERTARRGLEDYVETLRKHISDGNPPPPPPWPEGLRR